MRISHLRWILIAASSFIIAGCGSTLVRVPHAIRCEVGPDLMAGKCPSPTKIADDATFGGLVDAMLADRQALRECGVTVEALRDSINKCNQATDAFNKKIDEINGKNAKDSN